MRLLNGLKHWIHIIWWKTINNEKRIIYLRKQGVVIGSNCSVSSDVVFGTEPYLISIGNNVRLTSKVQFITHDGSIWVLRNLGLVSREADLYGIITIGNNVNIGWNTVILPGITIGDNCIIGANSVVTHNIPNNCVVAGSPARIVKSLDDYYLKVKDKILLTKGMDSDKKKKIIMNAFIK
ncbi:MAG: acyltransferase [Paenibacillaceae bacterium]|nr:acyltransferase [Paenibacillaceae bacterium]